MTAGDPGSAGSPEAPPDGALALLTIDLGAIAANYRLLCTRFTGDTVAAVVKADAYGLGAAEVAPALRKAGCRTFFVATATEALALREVLPDIETIYVLHGLAGETPELFAAANLRPVLNSIPEIELWRRSTAAAGIPAALHLDTGMSRLGITAEEFARLVEDPAPLRGLRIALVMSHLACPDTPDNPLNGLQRQRYAAMLDALQGAGITGFQRSLSASSGLFLGTGYHFEMARPGAALFGVAPLSEQANPMQQVVTLQAKILQVRRVDRDSTVGYGATHRFNASARLATVGVGYADGYFRSLGNRGSAYLGDWRIPLVGRVSMDLSTFDVTGLPDSAAAPGVWIELIGARHPVDALAAEAGTNGYEILTALGDRYARRYVGGPAA